MMLYLFLQLILNPGTIWVLTLVFGMGGAWYLLIHMVAEGRKIKMQQINDGKNIVEVNGKVDVVDTNLKNMDRRQTEHHAEISRRLDELSQLIRSKQR